MTKKTEKKYKGVFQPNTSFEKLEKKGVALPVSLPERKSVRYRCARISNKNWEEDDGLKERIEKQFEADMNWNNFTTIWDVAQDDPYLVVRK